MKSLAIDLGTSNSRLWVAGEGLVLNEPTVVTVSVEDGKVLAVGDEAKRMIGRTPEYVEAVRPVRGGVIADYEATEAFVKRMIREAMGRGWLARPEGMVAVPAGVTQVEQRAVLDVALAAGARRAYLIDQPLAAAIGAKIPVAEASGHMIVCVGGGVAEAAVIALGGVVSWGTTKVAGDSLSEAIREYLRKKHNLVVGEQTAETLKMELGEAMHPLKEGKRKVRGRDAVYGLPKDVEVNAVEIYEVLKTPLAQILGAVKQALEKTPPELVADIVDKGLVLCGGGVKLKSFDKWLTEELGVVSHIVDEPEFSVIRGVAGALENIDLYRRVLKN